MAPPPATLSTTRPSRPSPARCTRSMPSNVPGARNKTTSKRTCLGLPTAATFGCPSRCAGGASGRPLVPRRTVSRTACSPRSSALIREMSPTAPFTPVMQSPRQRRSSSGLDRFQASTAPPLLICCTDRPQESESTMGRTPIPSFRPPGLEMSASKVNSPGGPGPASGGRSAVLEAAWRRPRTAAATTAARETWRVTSGAHRSSTSAAEEVPSMPLTFSMMSPVRIRNGSWVRRF
mmetsp:Transcript_102571/g.330964  ORF Transcript_102571/g.330964 Transcript_102571/m.330964 type:complete len:235 (-) Transcript_102571:300-1004(-)